MKMVIFEVLLALGFMGIAEAHHIDWAKETQVRPVVKTVVETSRLSVVADLVPQASGGHSAALTWTLSLDDTTTACTASAGCLQNAYRAPGACSASSSFTLLTMTALGATATTFTDSTITPGVWCYGVTFEINGLESAKDTVTVTLQPAPPTGVAVTTK